MDVHAYDAELLESKALILRQLEMAHQCTRDDKMAAFADLRAKISHASIPYYNAIINDYIHHPLQNYDPTNDLYADDLLYLCYQLKYNNTIDVVLFTDVLNEQLVDMQSGMCAQGRTHRLFQVVITFIDYLPLL